ncbi:MAG: phospho-N-acetylmuramoyl-pentapeptide-transferase [Paludibacter sp.]|jgi:phospho-N-acetylmuramoyl-pentapeptide-transferase|nr:phospho-N-acetylmuramoyl-pentapeptide-transferase [Paludibacter sp.]
MLYHIFSYLDKFFDIPGVGLFNYISFRAAMSFIVALLIATIFGRKLINLLQRKQIGETIRNLDLEGQMQKKGTPTMGGIIIILAIVIPTLLLADLTNIYTWLMLITVIWTGAIGFLDDFIKVFKKNKEGLKGKFKIIGQVGLGLIVGLVMWLSPDIVIQENSEITNQQQEVLGANFGEPIKAAQTTIPFFKNNNLDYRDLVTFMPKYRTAATWILFVLVTIFIVTAVSNGANLTDGLDGLATGLSAVIGVTLGILAYVSSNMNSASYLNIMFIPRASELVIFAAAFIGATIGFLWYNSHPAQIFMGDTGSLMLGGVIAVFAIIIRKELLLPILCGVFLVESLSVICQTTYFKFTRKRYGTGRRIFKMAPLHHHFQTTNAIESLIRKPLIPIPESKMVIRFWIVGLILAAVTIITLKIR